MIAELGIGDVMSRQADINDVFSNLLKKHPNLAQDILTAEFEIYEAFGWDTSAGNVVKEMMQKGLNVDGNMMCYVDNA